MAGLIKDPFIHHFLPPTRLHDRPVKDPLINRGTFLRVESINHALSAILSDGVETQLLSLGAGFDTRFFNFKVTHRYSALNQLSSILKECKNLLKYVEVDFEEVISRKQHVIMQHGLPIPVFIPADLEVNFTEITLPRIASFLDTKIRTVIIAECSLMYLQDECVQMILNSLSQTFMMAHLIAFEPLYIGDRFGKTMEKNLSERGLPTESFMKYPTAETYKSRLESYGWNNVRLTTMAELSRNLEYSAL